MILCYEYGKLIEKKNYQEALRLESQVSPIISIAGAGGKTTTALRLAYEYKKVGRPVVVTTSTHLEIWEKPWFLLEESVEKLEQILKQEGQVWVGVPLERQKEGIRKMKAVSDSFFREICNMEIPIIIEADGARRMPCKVPAEHEPVILPQTTIVCSVYGMDAIGQKLCDCCFRSELAAKLLKKQATDRLEADDLVKIMIDEKGGKKGVRKDMEHWFILNKADTDKRKAWAEEISEKLEQCGVRRILVTSFEEEKRSEKFMRN